MPTNALKRLGRSTYTMNENADITRWKIFRAEIDAKLCRRARANAEAMMASMARFVKAKSFMIKRGHSGDGSAAIEMSSCAHASMISDVALLGEYASRNKTTFLIS